MRKTASLLAITLLTTPVVAQAEEPASADPFKPVQPAWPSDWHDGKKSEPANQGRPVGAPQAEGEKPAAQPDDNEVFTFDNESPPSEESEEDSPETKVADEPPVEPVPTEQSTPTVQTKPLSSVDLRTPNTLIAVGAAVIGVAAITGLALGIALDKNDLAALSFAGGGLLGLGLMTTGVVMRDQRLEETGHGVTSPLPSGLALKVTLVR